MLPEIIDNMQQIFCRTRRKEKLKIICQNLIRNLGNEHIDNKTDDTSTSNENINERIDYNMEEETFDENRLENYHKETKNIGGYLLQKAISNAKTLNMKIDSDDNNDDAAVTSNNSESTVYHSSSRDSYGFNNIYALPVKEGNIINNNNNNESECNLQDSLQLTTDIKIEYTFNTTLQESQFFHLKDEIDYESQRIKEISKLFDTFKESAEFYGSQAHLEAEKLMLLGCYRRNYLIECIRDNHYEDTNKYPAIVASMNLSDFRVPLRRNLSNNYNEWFICIVSCYNEIFISEPVKAELNWLRFEEIFYFQNICWGSVIEINVYSMRIPKLTALKKLLNKNTNKRQSKKLLYKDHRTYDVIECKVNNSMFKLCATGRVQAQDRNQTEIILDICELYDLEDKIFVKVDFDKLRFISNYSGFLTIGNEINGAFLWSRKWCVLNGKTFQYWNYPNDEAFIEPLFKIDLKEFTRIRLADRSKCPKSRTFIIETKKNFYYYFSADTTNDLSNWTNALKEVVACLKGWNI